MNALLLKCIAMLTMLIDHIGAAMMRSGMLSTVDTTYRIFRIIGRVAFPIFCFQIVQGVYHSKNLFKYGLRLLIFAVISEIPFDFGLHFSLFDPLHQNVYWTLFAGFLCVAFMKLKVTGEGKSRIANGVTITAVTLGIAELATRFHTDYGASGVLMIAIMGLFVMFEKDFRFRIPIRFIAFFFASLGVMYCAFTKKGLEYWALFAILPIALYNWEKGYSTTVSRLWYAFYPVHLIIIGFIFALPFVVWI